MFFSGALFRSQIKYRRNITLIKSYFSSGLDGKEQNSWQSSNYSLYFKANDDRLNFDDADDLVNANDDYSGGLLFLGLCLNKNKDLKTRSLFDKLRI